MIRIEVTGPGGIISYEIALIKKTLEDRGYYVDVEDSEPECVLEERKSNNKLNVKLIANHCPWGG